MEIHVSNEFGPYMQQLGIAPKTRVGFKETSNTKIFWDLGRGLRFTVSTTEPSLVTEEQFVIPARLKEILAADNSTLEKWYDEGFMDGWSEDQETLFTELTVRGVSLLPGRRKETG